MLATGHQTENSQIVGLCAAAGENNLRRTRIQQCGNAGPGSFDGRASVLSVMVNGRRVAEFFKIKRPHCLKHFREDGSGGVVVEVNAAHTSILRAKTSTQRN